MNLKMSKLKMFTARKFHSLKLLHPNFICENFCRTKFLLSEKKLRLGLHRLGLK